MAQDSLLALREAFERLRGRTESQCCEFRGYWSQTEGQRPRWALQGGGTHFAEFRGLAARAVALLGKPGALEPVAAWLSHLGDVLPEQWEGQPTITEVTDQGPGRRTLWAILPNVAKVSVAAMDFLLAPETGKEVLTEAPPPAKAATPHIKKRRRSGAAEKPRPLTPPQAEAIQIVGECKGNMAEAARRLGKDRKTLDQAYRAGLTKLGKQPVRYGTRTLYRDRRGQENIAKSDDRRG